ncbi:MAG: imidazoleglycerol-phosphate dehydratase HisB [Ferruginibacter sp.]
MKKILFLNEGVLLKRITNNTTLDIHDTEFYPMVFQYLYRINSELGYNFVWININPDTGNQENMIKHFTNEGILFSDILSNKILIEETYKINCDPENSYIISNNKEREISKRIPVKTILLGEKTTSELIHFSDWQNIYQFLKTQPRKATVTRSTSETNIQIELNLDGNGISNISTGLRFFDHMLEQIARHGNVDLSIQVKGDLDIDEHHTMEDVGLALGDATLKALGNKKGIDRYGFLLPMDDCLAQVAVDFGGRPWLVWNADFKREKIGDVPTEMFMHFFKSFSDNARCNLNIQAEGTNEHHKIESIFKAFAKALKMAFKKNDNNTIPSTKGIL